LRLAEILPAGEPVPANPGPITQEITRLIEHLPPEHRQFALEVLRLTESLPPETRQQVLAYVRFLAQQTGAKL
jgi:hypothetical protein